MKIVVLAGGLSTERDVSFVTGDNVCKALRTKGHQVILLDVFMGYKTEEEDISNCFENPEAYSEKVSAITDKAPDLKKIKAMRKDQSDCFFGPNVIAMCQKADIVFMALHGENGENGKIQAAFDLLGIRYTGTDYLSSGIALNKQMTKMILQANGIQTAKGISVRKGEEKSKMEAIKALVPCVVKPCCGGSSIGVTIVKDEKDLESALQEGFSYEDEVLVEAYIEGREFSVGVLGDQVLPIIEIAPIEGFYDYKNKYKAGSAVETCPANLSKEITEGMQRSAKAAAVALGLKPYSRIDFLLDSQDEFYCLEANTLPGMTKTSLLPQEAAAIGIGFEELCEMIIEYSLKNKE